MTTVLRRAGRWVLGPAGFDELAVVRSAIRLDSGVLADVGAHHGYSLAPFVAAGWRVYAFEPDPDNLAVLMAAFGGHPRVTIDGRAISGRDGERLPLFTSSVSTGISTLTPFHPSHAVTATVSTIRLDTALTGVQEVTVLKTDTEGHDLPVLETFPWNRLHPRAVVCEFEDRKTRPLGYGYEDLAGYLAGRGYTVLVSEWDPVVEYGQTHRWRSIRHFPAPLADPRGWGNLIAAQGEDARRMLRRARFAGMRLQLRRMVTRVANWS